MSVRIQEAYKKRERGRKWAWESKNQKKEKREKMSLRIKKVWGKRKKKESKRRKKKKKAFFLWETNAKMAREWPKNPLKKRNLL